MAQSTAVTNSPTAFPAIQVEQAGIVTVNFSGSLVLPAVNIMDPSSSTGGTIVGTGVGLSTAVQVLGPTGQQVAAFLLSAPSGVQGATTISGSASQFSWSDALKRSYAAGSAGSQANNSFTDSIGGVGTISPITSTWTDAFKGTLSFYAAQPGQYTVNTYGYDAQGFEGKHAGSDGEIDVGGSYYMTAEANTSVSSVSTNAASAPPKGSLQVVKTGGANGMTLSWSITPSTP